MIIAAETGRTTEDALAHAEKIRGYLADASPAATDLVLLADEVERLRAELPAPYVYDPNPEDDNQRQRN